LQLLGFINLDESPFQIILVPDESVIPMTRLFSTSGRRESQSPAFGIIAGQQIVPILPNLSSDLVTGTSNREETTEGYLQRPVTSYHSCDKLHDALSDPFSHCPLARALRVLPTRLA
jgi:hypothetical protein